MIFCNEISNFNDINRNVIKTFVLLLSPFAPHLGEELWSRLNEKNTLAYETWPDWDEAFLVKNVYKIPVQINGKVRDNISLPNECNKDDAFQEALKSSKLQKYLNGTPCSNLRGIHNSN